MGVRRYVCPSFLVNSAGSKPILQATQSKMANRIDAQFSFLHIVFGIYMQKIEAVPSYFCI